MTDDPKSTSLPVLVALLIAPSVLACGDTPRRPDAPPPESESTAAPSLPPARYVTVLAWTAGGGRPSGVLWMENWTGASGDLVRMYRGWRLDGDTAREVLAVDDTLPVAPAAWRPLPAPGLRLSVDPGGRLSSLDVGGGRVRLRLDRELASWRGATGADQRLRRGRLLAPDADTAVAGVIAAVLRFERLPGGPGPAGPGRTLLLSGEDGRGLLVLDEGTERPWSRGWAWNGEGALSSLDPTSLPDTARGRGAWTFPGASGRDAADEWRVPEGDSLPASGADSSAAFRVLPASGRVGRGAGVVPARGYLLVAP